jgi:hypothetical protein
LFWDSILEAPLLLFWESTTGKENVRKLKYALKREMMSGK